MANKCSILLLWNPLHIRVQFQIEHYISILKNSNKTKVEKNIWESVLTEMCKRAKIKLVSSRLVSHRIASPCLTPAPAPSHSPYFFPLFLPLGIWSRVMGFKKGVGTLSGASRPTWRWSNTIIQAGCNIWSHIFFLLKVKAGWPMVSRPKDLTLQRANKYLQDVIISLRLLLQKQSAPKKVKQSAKGAPPPPCLHRTYLYCTYAKLWESTRLLFSMAKLMKTYRYNKNTNPYTLPELKPCDTALRKPHPPSFQATTSFA